MLLMNYLELFNNNKIDISTLETCSIIFFDYSKENPIDKTRAISSFRKLDTLEDEYDLLNSALFFNYWLIYNFGADKYVNFLKNIYIKDYTTLDEIYIDNFGYSLNVLLQEWSET